MYTHACACQPVHQLLALAHCHRLFTWPCRFELVTTDLRSLSRFPSSVRAWGEVLWEGTDTPRTVSSFHLHMHGCASSVSGAGGWPFGLILVILDFAELLPCSAVPGLCRFLRVSHLHIHARIHQSASTLTAAAACGAAGVRLLFSACWVGFKDLSTRTH